MCSRWQARWRGREARTFSCMVAIFS
uniref:Uncharacterized protein n=1 Tax=Anguilla anguilla TaxID=7936 RepID=A0A0E9U3P5_ANGAN